MHVHIHSTLLVIVHLEGTSSSQTRTRWQQWAFLQLLTSTMTAWQPQTRLRPQQSEKAISSWGANVKQEPAVLPHTILYIQQTDQSYNWSAAAAAGVEWHTVLRLPCERSAPGTYMFHSSPYSMCCKCCDLKARILTEGGWGCKPIRLQLWSRISLSVWSCNRRSSWAQYQYERK